MAKVLISGFLVLIAGIVLATVLTSTTQAQTPTDTASPTASATASATATATSTAAATTAAATSPAATTGTVTASPVQPAAVPVTGGEPSNGTNLALILLIGIGAVAGTAGVLAASYGLTRRS